MNKLQKLILSFIILLFSLTALLAQTNIDNPASSTQLIKNNFFPNDEGTINEKKLIKYLEDFCKNEGLKYTITSIIGSNYISNSLNFEVILNNEIITDEEIIILCPLNSPIINEKYYDNSLSIKIATEILRKNKNLKLDKKIRIIFSGANNKEVESEYLGLKKIFDEKIKTDKIIILLLDILSNDGKIRFSGSVNKIAIPYLYLNYFFKNKINQCYFNGKEVLRSRFGILKERNMSQYLLDRKINVLSFSNRENTNRNIYSGNKDYENQLVEYFTGWIIFLDKIKHPIEEDYNYQNLNLFGIDILIPEFMQVIIYIILIFITILIWAFLKRNNILNINLLLKILPYILLLFLLYFVISILFYFISIFFVNSGNEIFTRNLIVYLCSVFVISALFFLAFSDIFKKIPFPKYNILYIYYVIYISYINLFLSIFIDINIASVILWVIIIVTLSIFKGFPYIIKLLLYIISAIPFIFLIINASEYLGEMYISEKPGSVPILFTFIMCLLSFPFILLIIRSRSILKYKLKLFGKSRIFLIAFFICFIFAIFINNLLSGYSIKNDSIINVNLIRNDSGESSLSISSIKEIGDIQIITGKSNKKIKISGKDDTINLEFYKPYYDLIINKNKTSLFNNYIVKINSIYVIEYLTIYFISDKDVYPLESNSSFIKEDTVLFTYDKEKEDVYKFLIPRNAGNSFRLNLNLVKNRNYRLFISIKYPLIDEKQIQLQKNDVDTEIIYYSTFYEKVELK